LDPDLQAVLKAGGDTLDINRIPFILEAGQNNASFPVIVLNESMKHVANI